LLFFCKPFKLLRILEIIAPCPHLEQPRDDWEDALKHEFFKKDGGFTAKNQMDNTRLQRL
jgi:hypothetical protein